VICVIEFSVKELAGISPNFTADAFRKKLPVIVTTVPAL
jgi:hypothetical protein